MAKVTVILEPEEPFPNIRLSNANLSRCHVPWAKSISGWLVEEDDSTGENYFYPDEEEEVYRIVYLQKYWAKRERDREAVFLVPKTADKPRLRIVAVIRCPKPE